MQGQKLNNVAQQNTSSETQKSWSRVTSGVKTKKSNSEQRKIVSNNFCCTFLSVYKVYFHHVREAYKHMIVQL